VNFTRFAGKGVLTGLLLAAPAVAWDFGGPVYQRGFPNAPAPSIFGYNLDDPHPGYFGGGRYREYYNYGRGNTLANFPDPLPNYSRGYMPKAYRGYPSPWTAGQVIEPIFVAPAEPIAYLDVQVPENAEVWIDDTKTQQSGAARVFVTPPLAGDGIFTYEIKARWDENGKPMEQTQVIVVQSGKRVSVAFPVATEVGAASPLPYPLEK
jgi:uncharacterized protein (TIGR03000 family)